VFANVFLKRLLVSMGIFVFGTHFLIFLISLLWGFEGNVREEGGSQTNKFSIEVKRLLIRIQIS